MTDDLNMGNGLKYNTAVTLFFVPYTLLEVPSNIVLKMMRPSLWMAILMFCWGLVMTLMGLTSSYAGLLAGRFFLGVAEVREIFIHYMIEMDLIYERLVSSLQQRFFSPSGTAASKFSAAWLSSTWARRSLVLSAVSLHMASNNSMEDPVLQAGNGSSSSKASFPWLSL
jgi:hypothetical protein